MIIDPNQQSFKDNYKLMIGSIVPRPIAFVSTKSSDGIDNLAPFSIFYWSFVPIRLPSHLPRLEKEQREKRKIL